MLKIGLPCVAILGALYLLAPPRRSEAQGDAPARRPGAFAGKYVGANYTLNGVVEHSLLHNVEVCRLGGRDFLVGEPVEIGGRDPARLAGAVAWLPIDKVDSLLVIPSKDQAMRLVEDAAKRHGPKPPPPAIKGGAQ